jgi:hypothetical protein
VTTSTSPRVDALKRVERRNDEPNTVAAAAAAAVAAAAAAADAADTAFAVETRAGLAPNDCISFFLVSCQTHPPQPPPLSRAKHPSDAETAAIVADLRAQGVLAGTPSRDRDDLFIIEYARRHRGRIVSNDLFRDHVALVRGRRGDAAAEELRAWLAQAVVHFTFVGDEFVPNPESGFG